MVSVPSCARPTLHHQLTRVYDQISEPVVYGITLRYTVPIGLMEA